jgi:bifunctional non-homologous end joining protein LigD
VKVAGVALSNPDRVLYPGQGITKRELAAYYEAIAPLMLPHVAGRPLVLVRCPEGQRKECFYQKHWTVGLPDALGTVDIEESSGAVRPYVTLDDAAGLVSLIQHGVLEIHVWGARADDVDLPDRVVFDLDPGLGVSWRRVIEGAKDLKERLEALGLETWLKTSGGKGMHIVVPIARRSAWDDAAAFARAVAYGMASDSPKKYIAKASKAARKGLIFVDWVRNTRGATAVAPWSTRARPEAPIAMPVPWDAIDELKSGDQFRFANIHELVRKRRRDPWADLPKSRQRLTKSMLDPKARKRAASP